jgi:hypothetical protein
VLTSKPMGRARWHVWPVWMSACAIACATHDGSEGDRILHDGGRAETGPIAGFEAGPVAPDDATAMIDAAAVSDAAFDAVPVCDNDGGAAPLLRPGCPERVPSATDCLIESLQCLYPAGDGGGCFDTYECVFGLWSPRGLRCEDTQSPLQPDQPGCPAAVPVHDTPCDHAAECQYGRCWTSQQWTATCVCGRWVVIEYGCPSVP